MSRDDRQALIDARTASTNAAAAVPNRGTQMYNATRGAAIPNAIEVPAGDATQVGRAAMQHMLQQQAAGPPAHVQRVLANLSDRSQAPTISSVMSDGHTWYRQANMRRVQYKVNGAAQHIVDRGSLVDGGCNGGIAGADMRVMTISDALCNVVGLEDHTVTDLPLVSACAVAHTNLGVPVLLWFHQYAYLGTGSSIHSSGQLRHMNHVVDDVALSQGGSQRIVVQDGSARSLPLSIRGGLPYLDLHPPTDEELESIQFEVLMTSDAPWNPTILDNEYPAADLALLPERDETVGFIDGHVADDGSIVHIGATADDRFFARVEDAYRFGRESLAYAATRIVPRA